MNSDVQIAGDPLAIPHLLPPVPAHPTTVSAFAGLARSIAADRAGWEHLVQYDATSRWYHRLRTVPQALGSARAGETPIGYEVWLLSWVPGQSTGAHDHGASSGVLTVLQGELTERAGTAPAGTAPADPALPAQRTLAAGAQRVFAPGYVHDIANDSLEPAVSLHIYFPGLTDMPMHHTQVAESAPTTLGTVRG
ncbi:cysteine dioxygenase family protein [Streptomyces sp. XD-27]|uniref:cysteine dioxygenase n=1 Tax=Streptomyces sp. XD-27 TaxID=3062779 RepID=UPI0026F412F7|nr:cysteine dioxygenase family protein [Streptomyces sp. XD-27]WKX70692.1 cysteine dioxygenase family protein [Streptomyces sp. XD-27]